MVYFRGSTSSSSKAQYLIISDRKDSKVETRLLVETPLVGQYVASWPSLGNPSSLSHWTLEYHSRPPKTWELCSSFHHTKRFASSLPCLGRRILNGETGWSDTFALGGEFHYIPGYWEWTEDVLSRSHKTVKEAKIYDAVYKSLFTYDRNTNIMQAFCEAWCPLTNTLLTSAGEISVSLWDLNVLGGLPIAGTPYEEVVPNVTELTGTFDKGKRYLPQICEHLFDVFHQLREGGSNNPHVPVRKWVKFWCMKAAKYEQPPPRREKKTARFKSSHNPTGEFDEAINWSTAEEALFQKLGVMGHKKDETYLAAFLSCWLCIFVMPRGGDFIRPGIFKPACHLACGRRVGLAVPVLASIYRGLNTISQCPQLDLNQAYFPAHYVYAWLAYYFKTHYPLANAPSDHLMTFYSGEGGAKYFGKEEARKRIHKGENIAWGATMVERPDPHFYYDDGTALEYLSNNFLSIRSNYLPLRDGGAFIIEPYCPHRFSRQFGYFQDVPGRLDQDFREASLEDGLRLARICVLTKSKARAVFPPSGTTLKKFSSPNYKTWWEKVHGSFLESRMQSLVNAVELVTDVLQQHGNEVLAIDKPPILQSKVVVPKRSKGPPDEEGKKEKAPTQARQASDKRPSPDESADSDGDRNFKRVRACPSGLEDTNSPVVEISDSIGSSSRTLTAIKKPNIVEHRAGLPHEGSQASDESIAGPKHNPKSSSTAGRRQETSSTSHDQVLKGEAPGLNEITRALPRPNAAVSIFEGKGVVSNHKKKYILGLWMEICDKLSRTSPESISSCKEDINEIFKEMNEVHFLDLSSLKNLVDSLFELATSYDQDQSNLADKMREDKKLELLSKAKERLESFKLEEERKAE